MRPSFAFAALLMAPAALASPLEAKHAVPTCDPNNVELLKKHHPTSKKFCSSWEAKPAHQTSPMTSLSPKQVSNICSCILASSYVASPTLTEHDAAPTFHPSSSSTSKSTKKTGSTTTSKPTIHESTVGKSSTSTSTEKTHTTTTSPPEKPHPNTTTPSPEKPHPTTTTTTTGKQTKSHPPSSSSSSTTLSPHSFSNSTITSHHSTTSDTKITSMTTFSTVHKHSTTTAH